MVLAPVSLTAGIFADWASHGRWLRECVQLNGFDVAEDIKTFGCVDGSGDRFLLRGLAYIAYVGSAAMAGAGASLQGRVSAWDDAFVHRRRRNTAYMIGIGAPLIGVSVLGLIGSRITMFFLLRQCETLECIQGRTELNLILTGVEFGAMAAGAGLLGFHSAYRRHSRRFHVGFAPSLSPRHAGMSIHMSF